MRVWTCTASLGPSARLVSAFVPKTVTRATRSRCAPRTARLTAASAKCREPPAVPPKSSRSSSTASARRVSVRALTHTHTAFSIPIRALSKMVLGAESDGERVYLSDCSRAHSFTSAFLIFILSERRNNLNHMTIKGLQERKKQLMFSQVNLEWEKVKNI